MFGTVYKSYSGIIANSTAIDLSANNLANSNTIGFKRSSANFGQIMSDMTGQNSGNGNSIQFGLGAITHSISPHFTQGSIQNTGIATNLALLGDGFFATNRNGVTEYTRAGNFGFNEAGQLLTATGNAVQGYLNRDENGQIDTNGAIGDIDIDFEATSTPRASSVMHLITNLSAAAETGANHSSVIDVFDAEGVSHKLTVNFTKTATDGEWSYEFSSTEDGISLDAAASGTLNFDENGQLSLVDGQPLASLASKDITISGLPGGDLPIEWQLANASADAANPVPYITSYSAYSNTGTQYQDGFGAGKLQNIDFRPDGTMVGIYDNGDTVELAKVSVVNFQNVDGLKQSGGGYFRATAVSGEGVEAAPGLNTVLGNSLEVSNVDVAEELTNLIVHQRGFSGNSKAITTADQILQEILGLKR